MSILFFILGLICVILGFFMALFFSSKKIDNLLEEFPMVAVFVIFISFFGGMSLILLGYVFLEKTGYFI